MSEVSAATSISVLFDMFVSSVTVSTAISVSSADSDACCSSMSMSTVVV